MRNWLYTIFFLAFPLPLFATDCGNWNSVAFFYDASVADVHTCIAAGVDVNARDDMIGATSLHWAALVNDDRAILDALINAGGDVRADNNDGEKPLHLAAFSNKNPAMVIALVSAGADVNAAAKAGQTPLHVAIWGAENLDVIDTLLDLGANPNQRDHTGKNALDYAYENIYLKDTKVYWRIMDYTPSLELAQNALSLPHSKE